MYVFHLMAHKPYTYLHLYLARNHPAADPELPPSCLLVYGPHSTLRRFHEDRFFDTAVGRAVREWNSRNGISLAAWSLIISSAAMCTGCLRMFSGDGYNAHLDQGQCRYSEGAQAFTAELVQGPHLYGLINYCFLY